MKPGIKTLLGLALALALAVSGAARAEDAEGVVRIVGSALSSKTLVVPAGENTGPNLCRNDASKRIGRLSGMTLKVTGEWQTDAKTGEKRCFEASAFVVTKMSNGRDAVVGTLADKDGQFEVTDASGKVRMLADVPDGLKKLSGKKVILDVKTIESPAATKEAVSKVVSYAEFP